MRRCASRIKPSGRLSRGAAAALDRRRHVRLHFWTSPPLTIPPPHPLRRKRRQLLEVEGSGPSEYTVGGVDMDYSSLDCPAEWLDLLDSDPDMGACLPWQELLNPTVSADFKTPLGVGMRWAGEPYKCVS